jgi:hypothetical protein
MSHSIKCLKSVAADVRRRGHVRIYAEYPPPHAVGYEPSAFLRHALKRAACGLICAVMLTTSVTTNAQLQYVTNADGMSVTVTNYSGTEPSQIVIPDTFDGLAVTGIGNEAFADFTKLESVVIPDSVTSLGGAVFENSGVTNIVFPSSITNIPSYTLGDCVNLATVFIPDSVVSIGFEAFFGSGLNSLIIPGSVTNIGEAAVTDCGNLTNVIISYGVPYISSNMFLGCHNLGSATIAGSVTNIEDSAFEQCTRLSNILFTGNAPAVLPSSFEQVIINPLGSDTDYVAATAYYLPGTTGWAEFSSNTTMTPSEFNVTSNTFVPAVLWNPKIQATNTNFGVQDGQYGFDITATTNLPIAIEACDDLSSSNWITLQRVTITNGLFHFSEPFQSNSPARFYRIAFP